ncbi:MAG: hypothetical protein RUDDFDWM_000784 [Candidatus Fervidibacterota bacterium]
MISVVSYLLKIVSLCVSLFSDRRVPAFPKLILLFALLCIAAYIVIPIDVLPEVFIPWIGLLDDITIASLIGLCAIGLFLRLCPKDVLKEYAIQLGIDEQ